MDGQNDSRRGASRYTAVMPGKAGSYGGGSSVRRIAAMVLRYWYLLRGSPPRIVELIYWPTVQMVLWGFINQFMATNSGWVAQGAGLLISAVLLWDVLFRGQLGVSISFLEEMWSRNLGQLFVSPLRPAEWIVALFTMSLIRTTIGVVPASLFAIWFFDHSIYDLGLPLIAFFANLIFLSWALGLMIISMILRYGMGAEGLAWVVVFLIAPVSAVYYPVSALPEWLQWVALAMPPAHVYEGMRALIFDGVLRWDHLGWAALLNIVVMLIGIVIFRSAFRAARRRGSLLQTGE